jgi:membrane protein
MYASGALARSSTLFQDAFNRWNEHNAPRLGAALAFYTLLSLAPLLFVCATLSAAVFGAKAASAEITTEVRSWIGDSAADTIAALIAAYREPSGVVSGAIVLLALFFGASAVFMELRSALNEMWASARSAARETGFIAGVVRQRVFAFAMVAATGLFLIVSTAVSVLLSITGRFIGRFLAPSTQVLEILNVAMSFWILALIFALLFRLVPDVRLPWKPILVGAVLTTTLFVIGRGVLDLYFATARIGSMYGAAGSLVVIVVWIYYSAQILLFGAEFTKVYADSRAEANPPPRLGGGPRPYPSRYPDSKAVR